MDAARGQRLFGDKWVPALAKGKMRRVEILSTINSYSIGKEWSDKHAVLHDSILTRTLKRCSKAEECLLVHGDFPAQGLLPLKPEGEEFLAEAGRRWNGLDGVRSSSLKHEHTAVIMAVTWRSLDLDEDDDSDHGDSLGRNTG